MTHEEALRQIAYGRLPCRKCGQVHEPHTDPARPTLAPQWSAPDGHGFYEMTPVEFARSRLDR